MPARPPLPPTVSPSTLADRLRVQLALPAGQGRIGRGELVALVDALDRLRAYAQHLPTCGYHTQRRPYGEAMLPGPCTCGLLSAMEGPKGDGWGPSRRG